jgi:hypothetical protein
MSFIICRFSTPDMIRVMKSWRIRCEGYVTCMGKLRNAHKILCAKPEGEREFERPRCRYEDNIKKLLNN